MSKEDHKINTWNRVSKEPSMGISKREETVLLAAVSLVPRIMFGTSQGLRKHLSNERSTRVPDMGADMV